MQYGVGLGHNLRRDLSSQQPGDVAEIIETLSQGSLNGVILALCDGESTASTIVRT